MPKASQQDFRCTKRTYQHTHACTHKPIILLRNTAASGASWGYCLPSSFHLPTRTPLSLILIFFFPLGKKPRGLDRPWVWEPPLSYRQRGRRKKSVSEATLKQQFASETNHKVKQSLPSFLPVVVSSINQCQNVSGAQKVRLTLIRGDTLQCCFMYLNVSVCSADWALRQACRLCLCMCLCVFIPCQCQEPLRRGGQSALWEWDLMTQAALAELASKRRQAEIPPVHVCIQRDCVPVCMHARHLPRGWAADPKEASFQPLAVTLSRGITQDRACFGDFWYYKVNVKHHKQTPEHKRVPSRGMLRGGHASAIKLHFVPPGYFKGFISE